MEKKNSVFIATSLDGYIADRDNKIDWLLSIPNPEQDDMGYESFISEIDAIVMGRKTFEVVDSFGGDWPYTKPVYVLSNTLKALPEIYQGKVFLLNGEPREILAHLHQEGYFRLYIDGGTCIQSFLMEDLIDDMTITVIPYLLGAGSPLFGQLDQLLKFSCVESKITVPGIVQNRFIRER